MTETNHSPQLLDIDAGYLVEVLLRMLEIPSPSGYTDQIVHFVGDELERLGVACELTRRGAIRATLNGKEGEPDRAVIAHVDTIGAMVTELQDRGRVGIAPVGTWPARSAESCRVLVLTDEGCHQGTILPRKASGHVFGDEVDSQPSSWANLEVRVDQWANTPDDLARLGIQVGDFIAIDPRSEVTDTGFIVSRHLDNKAGVACLLAAARALVETRVVLPLDFHLLFTIFEEVGSGASAVLHQDVAEMVSIDNATVAPGQNSSEFGVTVAMMDSSGPFDYHLSKKLLRLSKENGIPAVTDVYRNYRCDAASAVEAGNDIRTALICFGLDASHHYERTHIDSLTHLARLVCLYAQSSRTFLRDRSELAPLPGFPAQPTFTRTGKSNVRSD